MLHDVDVDVGPVGQDVEDPGVGPPFLKPFRLLVAAAAVVLLTAITMSLVGANVTGMSVDDPRHVTRLNVYFETGLYNTGTEVKGARGAIPEQAYVYGPVTALLQHAPNLYLSRDSPGHAQRRADAYTVRHIVVALIGIVGLVAAGAIAWLLLGNWGWGVVAAGALAAVPMWTGHSMFNGKDIPVATGHTLATLGLVLLAQSRFRFPRLSLAAGAVVLIAGSVLMVGTRPGMWPSLAASACLLAAIVWWSGQSGRAVYLTLLGSLTASYAALLWIYPRIFSNPLTMLWTSAMNSAHYEHLKDPNTREYLFVHTGQEWPLILLGLFLFGTVAAVIRALGLLKARSAAAAGLVVVGSQAFTLPLLVVINDSHLYQGLRQVLFAVPAQAILATLGLAALISAARRKRSRVMWATIGALGLALPLAVQISMFPYQYVYNNVGAELAGVNPDNDYLGTSYREFVDVAPDDVKIICPQRHTTPRRNLGDCRTRSRGQLSPYWKASGRPAWDLPNTDEFYAIQKGNWPKPDYCKTVYEISRWRNLFPTTISRLVECDPPGSDPRNRFKPAAVDPFDPDWKGSPVTP